jgi:hypothetical protein
MILSPQLVGQLRRTLARPAQGGFGIPARRGFDQRQQRREHARIGGRDCRATPSGSTDSLGRRDPGPSRCPQFAQPGMDGRARQARGPRDQTDPAMAQVACLGGRPLSAPPLIQFQDHGAVLPANPRHRRRRWHATVMTESPSTYKYYLYELFLREP